jgi:hypothetical protein
MKLAVAISLAACASTFTDVQSAPSTTPSVASQVSLAWTVHATMPPKAGATFLDLQHATATRADRPTVFALGRVETTKKETVVKLDAHLGSIGDDLIGVREDAQRDATDVYTPSEHYLIQGLFKGATTVGAHYYDIQPGIVSVNHDGTKAVIRRYDHGRGVATWDHTIEATFSIDDARVVGWLNRDDAVLALQGEVSSRLLVLHVADGSSRDVATIPVGAATSAFVVAGRAGLVATIQSVEHCACSARVEVRELASGRVTGTFDLPTAANIWPTMSNETLGFDGAQLWGYSYRPAHGPPDMGIAPKGEPEKCTYEVYDAHNGTRLRTLADAIDDWAQLSADCAVRALIPTVDGGAVAVSVQGPKDATIAKFPAAP